MATRCSLIRSSVTSVVTTRLRNTTSCNYTRTRSLLQETARDMDAVVSCLRSFNSSTNHCLSTRTGTCISRKSPHHKAILCHAERCHDHRENDPRLDDLDPISFVHGLMRCKSCIPLRIKGDENGGSTRSTTLRTSYSIKRTSTTKTNGIRSKPLACSSAAMQRRK